MGSLGEQLTLAELRSRGQVDAAITGVELVDVEHEQFTFERIEVTYRIGASADDSVEASDRFTVPESNSGEYAFVRLCRTAHVPFEQAAEDLPGATVPASYEESDDEWSLVVPDTVAEADDDRSTASWLDGIRLWATTTDRSREARYYATLLCLPVVAPLVFADRWAEEGLVPAVLQVGEQLFIWTFGVLVVLFLVRFGTVVF